jgi:GT2 family glycosyltransferase
MILPRDADPGMRTCSEAWAECLRDGGFDVISADIACASNTATAVIVAPHATFRPLAGDLLRVATVLRRAVCVSTSRLASGALGADRPFHSAATASIALSRDSSRYLSAHGIPTVHLKPGGHARLRSPRAEPRAVSVGTHTRYSTFREDILARSRDVLDPHPCDLRISHSAADHPPGHLEAAPWLSWLTSIDVLLSLPPESGPGTDWCEVAPAVMNGAVVLTTSESDFGPLEPGEHVAIATGPGFADSLRRLLGDSERREQMRDSALACLAASPIDVSPLAEAILVVESNRRRVRPLLTSEAPQPADQPASAEPDMAAALAMAEAARSRRAQARSGGADRVTTTTGWEANPEPALSVVIPSYNQASFVSAAVESAISAVGVELEIVVVDDCSSDHSAAVVRSLLEAHDERALKLVECADNAGLSEARNQGFLQARAALVLLLDADDALLPHGPAALRDALQAAPDAAFAYGILARIGLEHEDLLGTSAWDPALFRHGNYVPVTCSLVRRSAWELVGGYTAEGLLELGWEDLDFWLRLADSGQHAAHVRRIVGTYRVHGVSMSTVTNIHAAALMTFLRERHPRLMSADDA